MLFFSTTYEDIQKEAESLWIFQKFQLVIEYNSKPPLPPPLNLLLIIYYPLKLIRNRLKTGNWHRVSARNGIVLFAEHYQSRFTEPEQSFFRQSRPGKLNYQKLSKDPEQQEILDSNEETREFLKETREELKAAADDQKRSIRASDTDLMQNLKELQKSVDDFKEIKKNVEELKEMKKSVEEIKDLLKDLKDALSNPTGNLPRPQ